MKVIWNGKTGGGRVVALGTFDGVHRGHRELLETGIRCAREHGVPLRACTFDRHPLEVIRPEAAPKILTTIPEKAALMAMIGVDEMQLIPFRKETADTEPEDFLDWLRETTDVRAVVAGWNYTFGRKGRGNAEMLREDGKRHGYEVVILPPVTAGDGTILSSSAVRERIAAGKIPEAEEMLGHGYQLSGTVRDGKHIGHRIGVPTANVAADPRKQLPAYGVYPCFLETADEQYRAVVNIGVQPTIPSGRVTVEAHVLEGTPELYGTRVRLTIGKMIREERRFASPEELTAQIRKDREEAARWFEHGMDGRKSDITLPCPNTPEMI